MIHPFVQTRPAINFITDSLIVRDPLIKPSNLFRGHYVALQRKALKVKVPQVTWLSPDNNIV